MREGLLPVVRFEGRRVAVPTDAVEELLAKRALLAEVG
jgi:hypothetical protein